MFYASVYPGIYYNLIANATRGHKAEMSPGGLVLKKKHPLCSCPRN